MKLLAVKILKRLHLACLCCRVEALAAWLWPHANGSLPHSADEALQWLHAYSPDPAAPGVCRHDFGRADCDVEVIVPCYNVERYVVQCVDSILSQSTRFSFFVTIVNDGSTDGTGACLQRYASVPNVRVLNQANTGFSGARNAGICQAHGRYLMFVDADDMLVPGAIDRLMCMAQRTDADIVDGGFRRFADRDGGFSRIPFVARLYDIYQRGNMLPYSENATLTNGFVCGKLIKRCLFDNIEFPLGYWFEDSIYCMLLEPMSKRIATIDTLVYRYRMRGTSISHTYVGKPKAVDNLYITLRLLADRQQLGLGMDARMYDTLLRQMHMNMWCIRGAGTDVAKAVFVVQRHLVAHTLAAWHTRNARLEPIEHLLRSADFNGYMRWCRWHDC